jgi:hypothetical protein
MLVRAGLEAGLQEAFDFAALAVYADALQGDGDPRGELIALDLYPAPDDPAWWGRRRAALGAWLGEPMAARLGHLVQHGFIHELREGPLAADVLDGPLGDYVRGYSAWGGERVARGLERLASRPRPWLARISVTSWSAPLPDELCERVVAAAPRLGAIHSHGKKLFRSFHPILNVANAPRDPGATGPALSPDDITFILDAADAIRDCNQLYPYYDDAFAEPMAVLLPRLRAAGLLELDGPVARPAAAELMSHAQRLQLAQPFRRRYSSPLWIDVGLDPPVEIGSIGGHAGALLGGLARLHFVSALHKALAAYLELLGKLGVRWTLVPPSLVAPLAVAFDAILEQSDLRAADVQELLELDRASTLLASPAAAKGVSLRVQYDDWYGG